MLRKCYKMTIPSELYLIAYQNQTKIYNIMFKATEEEIATGTKFGAGQLYQYGNKVTYERDGTVKPKYTSNIIGCESGILSQSHNWSTFKGFSSWNGTSFQKSDYTKSSKIEV